jgi:hypothetical protein
VVKKSFTQKPKYLLMSQNFKVLVFSLLISCLQLVNSIRTRGAKNLYKSCPYVVPSQVQKERARNFQANFEDLKGSDSWDKLWTSSQILEAYLNFLQITNLLRFASSSAKPLQ